MMARTVEPRHESNRLLLTASRSKVYAMLSFQYRAATTASAQTIGGVHAVIDIGVTALLTLRIALCRPPLAQLVDPNNDVSLPGEKDEQQECLFVGMEKGTNIYLESPHQDTVGLSQLHIHCHS
jgi:hypothetical protein